MKKVLILFLIFFACGTRSNNSRVTPPEEDDFTISDIKAENKYGSDPCADTVTYVISCKTSENSTAYLYWGTSSNRLNNVLKSEVAAVEHSFDIYPLLTGTTYYFSLKAIAEDLSDSTDTNTSSFTPEKGEVELPSFDDIRILAYPEHAYAYYTISHHSVSEFFFGLTSQYDRSVDGAGANVIFYKKLDSLIADTVFHYSISLEDNCGNIVEADWDSVFRTPAYPEIYFNPDTITGNPGDTIDVKVYIKNIVNLMAVEYQFYFPTSQLTYLGVSKGEILNIPNYELVEFLTLPNPPVANIKGCVTTWRTDFVNNYYIIGSYMKFPGNTPGHIATFRFRVNDTAAGEGDFTFITDRIRFLDPFSVRLKFLSYDGKFITE